jgi:peptidoglycan/xylan/chitin deacetylase (PgdA/CDA1 family)
VSRRAILGFAIAAPFIATGLFATHPILALATVFVSHLLVLYPTLVPLSQIWGPVITWFETSKREVWLTIDDGPDERHTPVILDLLDRYSAKATFFVVGDRVARYPGIARAIVARGHSIANHTFSHPSGRFWCLGRGQIAREIDSCAEAIKTVAGTPASFFRSPAGLKNFFLHPLLQRRGLTLVGWTARGFDTVRRDAATVVRAIAYDLRDGAIILLHEGHRSDPEFNPRCVELTLRELASRGYSCVIPDVEQLRTGGDGK